MSFAKDLIKGFAEPITDLVGKFVVDKDKAIQMEFMLQQLIASAVDSARAHDKASYGIWLVDFFRGLVRPVITLAVTAWYFYAKVNPEIEFTMHDYYILGGVLGFWFGGKFFGKDIQKR
jgi:hypothetical protein